MVPPLLLSLVLAVGVALPATSSGVGPLDPDPTFGDGGSVVVSKSAGAITSRGGDTVVAGPTGLLGGSGEFGVSSSLLDQKGVWMSGIYAQVESYAPGQPKVSDVVATADLNFVIGWQPAYPEFGGSYGYVAAFPAALDGYATWGGEEFALGDWDVAEPPWPGLERLREFPFTSVTAGAVDSRGRVLVAGRIDGQVAVVRLTEAGSVDPTFGSNGVARHSIGSSSAPTDLAVGRGLLLVGNTSTASGVRQGFALRLTANGAKNNTWGEYGLRLIDEPGSSARAVLRANKGSWLVGFQDGSGVMAGVQKLDSVGTLVDGFGTNGQVNVDCVAPATGSSVDTLSTWWTPTGMRRITQTMSCTDSGEIQRVAAIWRRDGTPITALQPDGVGVLPWTDATKDAFTTSDGRLMALTQGLLYRLG